MNNLFRILLVFGVTCAQALAQAHSAPIEPNASLEGSLAPRGAQSYSLLLQGGDTALIIVRQMGIDLVVEVNDPSGKLIDSVDSPTGRNGDEVVEVHASVPGVYSLRLRPYDDKEPAGRFALHFVWRHDRVQAVKLEEAAQRWVAARSSAVPPTGVVTEDVKLPPLERLANVRVVGLGEATHGSREFGDLRLSLTERLITHIGTFRNRGRRMRARTPAIPTTSQ